MMLNTAPAFGTVMNSRAAALLTVLLWLGCAHLLVLLPPLQLHRGLFLRMDTRCICYRVSWLHVWLPCCSCFRLLLMGASAGCCGQRAQQLGTSYGVDGDRAC